MNKDENAKHLARLRAWLEANKDVVKTGGLAHRAGLDDAAMSLIAAGTRVPRPATLAKLLDEATAFGFDRNEPLEAEKIK